MGGKERLAPEQAPPYDAWETDSRDKAAMKVARIRLTPTNSGCSTPGTG